MQVEVPDGSMHRIWGSLCWTPGAKCSSSNRIFANTLCAEAACVLFSPRKLLAPLYHMLLRKQKEILVGRRGDHLQQQNIVKA